MPTPFAIVQRNAAVEGLRNATRELRDAEAGAGYASEELQNRFAALGSVPRLSNATVSKLQEMMLDGVVDPREASVLRDLVAQASDSGTQVGDRHAAVFQGLLDAGNAPEMRRVVNARSNVSAATANLRAADEEINRYNAYPQNESALYDLAMVACMMARRSDRYLRPCDYRYLPIYQQRQYSPPLRLERPPGWHSHRP